MKLREINNCEECRECKGEMIKTIVDDGEMVTKYICVNCFKKWHYQRQEILKKKQKKVKNAL